MLQFVYRTVTQLVIFAAFTEHAAVWDRARCEWLAGLLGRSCLAPRSAAAAALSPGSWNIISRSFFFFFLYLFPRLLLSGLFTLSLLL
jgi:hypothetical protein